MVPSAVQSRHERFVFQYNNVQSPSHSNGDEQCSHCPDYRTVLVSAFRTLYIQYVHKYSLHLRYSATLWRTVVHVRVLRALVIVNHTLLRFPLELCVAVPSRGTTLLMKMFGGSSSYDTRDAETLRPGKHSMIALLFPKLIPLSVHVQRPQPVCLISKTSTNRSTVSKLKIYRRTQRAECLLE